MVVWFLQAPGTSSLPTENKANQFINNLPTTLEFILQRITRNTVSLQFVWPRQRTSSLQARGKRGQKKTQGSSSSFHAATTLQSSPPGSGRTDAHCSSISPSHKVRERDSACENRIKASCRRVFTSVLSFRLYRLYLVQLKLVFSTKAESIAVRFKAQCNYSYMPRLHFSDFWSDLKWLTLDFF